MARKKDFIDAIRRDKFSIGASEKQALAIDLHRAVTQLSTEIYQNSMHFVKELIQNAEDNKYEKQVRPSLEFLLVKEDVAEMGVPATLLVMNNERGLTTADVKALCSVRDSTKAGKRDEGYIGCKGIGFKSVFMVSKTPIIISNGFRIRFSDDPDEEAGVAYLVPSWVDTPTDSAILAACGRDEMPKTIILLPLRHDKVDLVRKQLKGLSAENILFLSKIRELHVIDEISGGFLNIIRSDPIFEVKGEIPPSMVAGVEVKGTYRFFKVTLKVESDQAEGSNTFSYLVFQGLFPVTHPDVERQEVHDWAISVGFPLEGRASSNVGDIFCFLPTELRSGFPFIVNADFILTSSRETIRFNTEWNIGILNCVPLAFEVAFSKMILCSKSDAEFLSDQRDAYKFLPVKAVDNAYSYSSAGSMGVRQVRQRLEVQPQQASNIQELEKIRSEIFQRVGRHKYIFLSSPGCSHIGLQLSKEFDLPAISCYFIDSNFRHILKMAAVYNHPAPFAVLERAKRLPDGGMSPGSKQGIVDEYVQDKYASGLAALGVSEMSVSQYESIPVNPRWLINLPEKVYMEVLSFLAFDLKPDDHSPDQSNLAKLAFLKVRVHTNMRSLAEDVGKTSKLTSFASLGVCPELMYMSSAEDADWLYHWMEEFSRWDPVEVLPPKTSEALIASRELMAWIGRRVYLEELSVEKYAKRLLDKLATAGARDKHDPKFSILALQFLYSTIRDKKLSRNSALNTIRSSRNVFVFDGNSSRERSATLKMREEGWVFMPPVVSKWPRLFGVNISFSQTVVALSDKYLDPQCSLVEKIVTKSPGPDSMVEFIKDAFHAVDLPRIKLPVGETVIFQEVTMDRSVAMLQWLQAFLPNRKTSRSESKDDAFLMSVQKLPWVKTHDHGWQMPTSVFFSGNFFEGRFDAHDLPFLDESCYENLNLTDLNAQVTFEELGLVTDVKNAKGCAVLVTYFSKLSAKQLDLERVSRFYRYFHEVAQHDQIRRVKIWIPAGETSEEPMWEDPAECIISDALGIFADSSAVTVLDKFYDVNSALRKFFTKLQVPEKASGAVYRKVWLEWSRPPTMAMDEDVSPQTPAISKVKMLHVWKDILRHWQEPSKGSSNTVSNTASNTDCNMADARNVKIKLECVDTDPSDRPNKGPQNSEGSENESSSQDAGEDSEYNPGMEDSSTADSKDWSPGEEDEEEDETWTSFLSQAWVPMAPVVITRRRKGAKTMDVDTISLVPPSKVLINDDAEYDGKLSQDFSKAANGKLNFVWLQMPHLSSQQTAKLVKLYSRMGVRKFSEMVTCEVRIPRGIWTKQPPRGKELLCEGLFRCVLAYLCKHGKKQGISAEARQNLILPLISATEVVVEKPFEKVFSLRMSIWTSPAVVNRKDNVFAHFNKDEGKLYYLEKSHPRLKTVVGKKIFNDQVATTVASRTLSEYPELVKDLSNVLSPLCESGFSDETVEYECKKWKLAVFPKDEKRLKESLANKEG
ncbi:unnamed protein product [Calypogeia fissa]